MFLVLDKRLKEVNRTASIAQAYAWRAELNANKAFRALAPFTVGYFPEAVCSAVVLHFPRRR